MAEGERKKREAEALEWERVRREEERKYRELEANVLRDLSFRSWNVVSYFEESVKVKSRQTLKI